MGFFSIVVLAPEEGEDDDEGVECDDNALPPPIVIEVAVVLLGPAALVRLDAVALLDPRAAEASLSITFRLEDDAVEEAENEEDLP